MNRHKAREQAFIVLFEKLFNKETGVAELFELGVASELFVNDEFSENLANSADSKSEEIDALVEENAIGWKIGRLPRVSLAILRLSVCEMLYFDDVPISVSINEAVELAKKYATAEDASYINGVLGTIAKKIDA